MTNYTEYRREVGVDNAEVINAIAQKYKGFTKIQNSMVNNPYKYGVCLLPEAEDILVEKYGWANGLNTKPKGKKPNRSKAHRLVVYVDDELERRAKSLMKYLNYETTQSFLEDAIRFMADEYDNIRKEATNE